ncbi:hypothetical protein SERLA73DRAFT_91073 [Serpula lacrymans var. lacrymans S7.3]|uniref:RNA polymerase II-associated protein 1 C-terminal domain-containing protein n=1 Tax=Serpula lacrymans var. lacrymans (strain S7.3) TaxID=936435 RepID=F8Q0T9_SERL3|nr:hypothetical protein SERLA73DRAFT_91073 [Serpula lacrymans var. lacrymans S7.3]
MRRQISEENERRMASMTEEEIDQERKDIVERFGNGVGDLLKKVKEARERRPQSMEGDREELPEKSTEVVSRNLDMKSATDSLKNADLIPSIIKPNIQRAKKPHSILLKSSTRPSSRTGRSIRFAEVTPEDVHVYESAPASPKRKPLALPPPPGTSNGDIISLSTWKGASRMKSTQPPSDSTERTVSSEARNPDMEVDPEEGTPEYIRRRFFPNVPAHDPSVAWMEALSSNPTNNSSTGIRFDLTGTPIPESMSMALPTHLGLHHHADGDRAGYTLDDIFLLSRSSIPAQRATMLGVLSKIIQRLRPNKGSKVIRIPELQGQEDDLRRRVLAAGLEAMVERGSVGARAVEAIWQCVVNWDADVAGIEGAELQSSKTDAPSLLQQDFFLSQIAEAFAQMSLPPESLVQLLGIVHRLAQQSNIMAETIMASKNLVSNILQTFLLTPIPPTKTSPLPNPSALQLLTTLAMASRSNASALTEPADALLRFVTILPTSSPFSTPLAVSLLTSTLRFYTVLGSYGMYAHIATTAAEQFAAVGSYVLSEACQSESLMEAWLGLLETWLVCATDPHRTTPPHEILWSQVVGWAWADDVLTLRAKLTRRESHWKVWAGLWRVEAAWLEGARVNGVRGGETERAGILEAIGNGFEVGSEKDIVAGALIALRTELDRLHSPSLWTDLASDVISHLRNSDSQATVIFSVLRLWLACMPLNRDTPLEAPPFLLPFSDLSAFCALLVNHPIWPHLNTDNTIPYQSYLRPLTNVLYYFLRLSRHIPGTSPDLWVAQAFSITCRLLPGDEENGLQVTKSILAMMTPDFFNAGGMEVPPIIWEKGGMSIITPFLVHAIRSSNEVYVGPICPSPQSIMGSTTQRLLHPTLDSKHTLPLSYNWIFSPIDHLLRSGTSPVFSSLSSSWDASETDVVRATLLLTKVLCNILLRHHLLEFVPTRAEIIFSCMKIFMLEHGQTQEGELEEVFRDSIVERFMNDLLVPIVPASSDARPTRQPGERDDLEKVAASFLGSSTPFYQFYTDFVALYDAISFSHPLFARLLFPPTSMLYPLDYRRHLWMDFGHLLKTIRTPTAQMITCNVDEYLWPVESNGQMLSAYLKALVKYPLDGFPRFIAVHHVACTIWPDLRGTGENEKTEASINMLKAVIEQGSGSLVKDIFRYRQSRGECVLLPPYCLEQDGQWKADRLSYVGRALSVDVQERMKGVFV